MSRLFLNAQGEERFRVDHAAERHFGTQLPDGPFALKVHSPAQCAGQERCLVHNPTLHHMSTWPLNWRGDKGVMERICPHGVGHDDPDDVWFHLQRATPSARAYVGSHGCDGCCLPNGESS